MPFARTIKLGQTSLGSQLSHLMIFGQSLAKGDPGDVLGEIGSDTTGRNTASTQHSVGFAPNIGSTRDELIIKVPLIGNIPAFSRIFQAILNLAIFRGTHTADGAGIVHNGSILIDIHGIRRTDFDFTTANFQIYKTTTNWNEYGAQVATDLTALKVGSFAFTQADYDGNPSARFFKTVDVKVEMQYRSDRDENALLILMPSPTGWRVTSAGREIILFDNPASFLTVPHSYITLMYVPPIVLHSSLVTSGRAIDLSTVLDKDSLESRYHLYMGFVDQGETGDPVKYWVRNTRNDRVARRIILECTRSSSNTPVAKSTNVGVKSLRSVDVYQLHLDGSGVVDELTPRGAWYAIATSTTEYSLYFQADFTGSYVLVGSSLLFSADNTYTDTAPTPDIIKLRIRAVKWSADVPTINDRWDFDTVGDTTSPTYPADSQGMMTMMPATTAQGDTADTSKEREISGGPTQRLRTSTYSFTDGGSPRSILLLADTQLSGYAIGQPGYIFDGTGFEAVDIRQIYLTADALPGVPPAGEVGDAIMLETELGRSYAAGAYFTPGLYIDALTRSQDAFVAASGAAAGQDKINLSTAVDWAPGDIITTIVLTGASAGLAVSYVVQSNLLSGSQIQLSTSLTLTLAEGDLVIKQVNAGMESFFVRGAVPEGATLGDRLALIRTYEARSSLQNIL